MQIDSNMCYGRFSQNRLFFLILFIFFNIGMVFLKFITARGTFSGILMPIVAVAPIGPFWFPFLLEIFAFFACVEYFHWRRYNNSHNFFLRQRYDHKLWRDGTKKTPSLRGRRGVSVMDVSLFCQNKLCLFWQFVCEFPKCGLDFPLFYYCIN